MHNLLPQDTVGTENTNSTPEDRRNHHSIRPLFLLLSGQYRPLQSNKHQGVSGKVIFFHHTCSRAQHVANLSLGHLLDVFLGLPGTTGQHPWDLQLPRAAADSFPGDITWRMSISKARSSPQYVPSGEPSQQCQHLEQKLEGLPNEGTLFY